MPGQSLSLLRSCFFEPAPALRDRLAPLGEHERAALYSGLGSLLEALLHACRYQEGAFIASGDSQEAIVQYTPKILTAAAIWPELEAHFDEAESWLVTEGISLYGARDAGHLGLMLQMLAAGLAPQARIRQGFEPAQDQIPYYHASSIDESWAYNLGRVLLDRPEAWRFELLLDFCARIGSLPSPYGYARLLRELLARHPEQAEAFGPWLGQSMVLDGFNDQGLEAYPAGMLLAGLTWEGSRDPELPLDRIAAALLPRLSRAEIPRAQLLDLLRRRMSRARTPARLAPWLALLGRLQAVTTASERDQLWLSLLGAAGAAAVKAAARALKSETAAIAGPALCRGALQAMRHRNLGAARAGFSLLRRLARRERERALSLLGEALSQQAELLPVLRIEVLSWLQSLAEPLPAALLTGLAALAQAGDLSLLERRALAALLPGIATDEPEPVKPLRPDPERIPPGRREFVQAVSRALVTGQGLAGLAAREPDSEAWRQDPVLAAFTSREAFVDAMLSGLQAGVNCRDFERLLAGALAWPPPAAGPEREVLRLRLAALLDLPARWQAAEAGLSAQQAGSLASPDPDLDALYALPQRSLHLALLAQGWLAVGPQALSIGPRLAAAQLGTPSAYCQLLQAQAALRALERGQRCLLATPDRLSGWIDPESLLSRLQALIPAGLDSEDLGHALLRLPPLMPEARQAIWQGLSASLEGLTEPMQRAALSLALSPAPTEALSAFLAYFADHPPDDWLLQIRFYTVQPRDTEPNRAFRLLSRAVLARCGLDDAYSLLPGLADLNQAQLLANGGLDHSLFNQAASLVVDGIKNFLARAAELPDELALPEPRMRMLQLARSPLGMLVLQAFWHPGARLPNPFEADASLRHLLEPQVLPYPQMAAHVIDWLGPMYQPGYGAGFEPDEAVLPLGWYLPILAQRLWQAAQPSLRQLGQAIDRHCFAAALIGFGRKPWVRVSGPELAALAPLLCSPWRPQREAVLALLTRLLADGRADFEALIGLWGQCLRPGEPGFSAGLRAARAWARRHPACEALLAHALEQRWARAEIQPSGRVLDLALELFQRQGLAVTVAQARAALSRLAAARSALATRAQLLLALPGQTADQALLEALPALCADEGLES